MAVEPLIRDILDKMLTAWERDSAAQGAGWAPGAASAPTLPRQAPSDRGGFPVDNGDGTTEQRDPAWWDAFYWPSADSDADEEGFDEEPLDFGSVSVYNPS